MTISATRILLARHAQTGWSKEKRYTGTTDVALSQTGYDQAAALGESIAVSFPPITAVYSSSLVRTFETAKLIAQHFGIVVSKLSEMNELDYGAWEGLTASEVIPKFPNDYKAWERDPASASPPQGETGIALVRRAQPTLLQLVEKHQGETVVIVGHKALNRLLICSQLGIPLEFCRRALEQDEACLNILDFEATGMRLVRLNDTSHYN